MGETSRLRPAVVATLADRANIAYLSAASAWEIAIKYSLGKLNLPLPPAEYIASRLAIESMTALAIEVGHCVHVAELPLHHHDPFDRMLVAQAQLESLVLVTADARLAAYEVEILWAGLGPSPRKTQVRRMRGQG